MKRPLLIILILVFFVLINTTYFWEGQLGSYAVLSTLILIFLFFFLFIVLIKQIYLCVISKFNDKGNIVLSVMYLFVLGFAIYKPNGMMDFDKLEGKDVLVAHRKGVAACHTTLKMKSNMEFRQVQTCFGVFETRGNYNMKGDTVFFTDIHSRRYGDNFFKFGIIKKFDKPYRKVMGNLLLYRSYKDTFPYPLEILEDRLSK